MGTIPSAFSPLALELVADTGVAGFALQDATPAILTWTAPNDGNMHRWALNVTQNVTSEETGGAVGLAYHDVSGTAVAPSVFAGGGAAGISFDFFWRFAEAGTTVTLEQTSALTAGAAVIYAEIWAA